jgi:hypothetical protein
MIGDFYMVCNPNQSIYMNCLGELLLFQYSRVNSFNQKPIFALQHVEQKSVSVYDTTPTPVKLYWPHEIEYIGELE